MANNDPYFVAFVEWVEQQNLERFGPNWREEAENTPRGRARRARIEAAEDSSSSSSEEEVDLDYIYGTMDSDDDDDDAFDRFSIDSEVDRMIEAEAAERNARDEREAAEMNARELPPIIFARTLFKPSQLRCMRRSVHYFLFLPWNP